MADRAKPTEVAKTLGIRPQIIYGLIKRNKIATFPNPAGGPDLVDVAETRIVTSRMKQRGPRKERTRTGGKPPIGIYRGTILSHDRKPGGKGSRRIAQVTDAGKGEGSLVWGTDGKQDLFWGTESLAERLKKGTTKIESIPSLLGMIMFQWTQKGHEDKAIALQEWCNGNGVKFIPITDEERLHADKDEPGSDDPGDADTEAERPEVAV